MTKVTLNKAMAEALRREAQRDLENSMQERALFRRPSTDRSDAQQIASEYEERLLACADVLGELGWSVNGWGVRGCSAENADTIDAEFSAQAMAWMVQARDSARDHLAALSEGNEGDYNHDAQEAYLVYVLDNALGTEAVAV